jgi:cytochrome c
MAVLHTWWFRTLAVIAIAVVTLLLIRLHVASGQAPPQARDPVTRGYSLARSWCSECHAIDTFSIPIEHRAPAFVAIASQRSTTSLSLRAFLQTSHEPMPNIVLAKGDLDDIIAYILSLRLP